MRVGKDHMIWQLPMVDFVGTSLYVKYKMVVSSSTNNLKDLQLGGLQVPFGQEEEQVIGLKEEQDIKISDVTTTLITRLWSNVMRRQSNQRILEKRER